MTPGRAAARLYLIDTSVTARTHLPEVATIFDRLLEDRAAATCITTDLEAGFSGRNHSDVLAIAQRRRDKFRVLPINDDIAQRAREVQLGLAARGSHRSAGVLDLLTAAVAEYHSAVLLHYDADFEQIAAVTGQAHMWVVPRGSI